MSEERPKQRRKRAPRGHVHHWLVDSENFGRCKTCPATKDFQALLDNNRRRTVSSYALEGMRRRRGLPDSEEDDIGSTETAYFG